MITSGADKNIVDRTRPPRNHTIARTLRTTRERLQTDDERERRHDRELVSMYLGSSIHGAAVMPALVLITVIVNILYFDGPNILLWALLALGAYALMAYLAKRANRLEMTHEAARSLHHQFVAAHAIAGCTWAMFAYQHCSACSGQEYAFFKAVVLLVAIAVTAMSTITLRRGPLLAFTTPIILFNLLGSLPANPVELIVVVLLVITLVFFLFVSSRLYQANVGMLAIQAEKDWLIAELEIAKATSDEARRRAEEANLAKSRFLASMSHELRTPLNAILGFSEVIKNEVLGPIGNDTYKEYVGDIHQSGDHLLNLINEILDLSRIEAGRYELHEESISLTAVVEECIGMIDLKAQAKAITIAAQFEPQLPRIWADERSVRQVVLNLMSNAVKFTPQGGEIDIKVGWTAGGGQYVSIRDNGPGIPEDEIPVVLSAFGQGSIAIKSAEQGTGLGLPIVQAILAEHGGEFTLKSRLREGTEATAVLPRSRVLVDAPSIEMPDPDRNRRRSFA